MDRTELQIEVAIAHRSSGFIAAETIGYRARFVRKGARSRQLRVEGKDYKVRDGDVITFRLNV